MPHFDVTCPETVRPETITAVTDRDGEILVVLRCTRFDPPEAITCTETCRLVGGSARCSCHATARRLQSFET
jgi:hypothetical protein